MKPDIAEISRRFPAAAEYLSSIYILKRDYGTATNSRLAAWLGVSGSAVTQALGRLKRLELAQQQRYEHIDLTDQGRLVATMVLKRHYIIEHVLVTILDFPWDKADDEAKMLQSQISDALTDHLYSRLGNPQTCPHGNPLPGVPIEEKLLKAPILETAAPGTEVRILRITEEGEQVPAMLEFCYSRGIQPARRFTILEKSDQGLVLSSNDSKETILMPLALARHIRYENI